MPRHLCLASLLATPAGASLPWRGPGSLEGCKQEGVLLGIPGGHSEMGNPAGLRATNPCQGHQTWGRLLNSLSECDAHGRPQDSIWENTVARQQLINLGAG